MSDPLWFDITQVAQRSVLLASYIVEEQKHQPQCGSMLTESKWLPIQNMQSPPYEDLNVLLSVCHYL